MERGAPDLVSEAKKNVENLTPEQVAAEIERGDAIVVDVREAEERAATGAIPGATHASRGMLEFYADPDTPYHRPEFERDRRIILHCASGGRSALAAQTLKQMGYQNVAHLDGGIKRWVEEGKPVEGGS